MLKEPNLLVKESQVFFGNGRLIQRHELSHGWLDASSLGRGSELLLKPLQTQPGRLSAASVAPECLVPEILLQGFAS